MTATDGSLTSTNDVTITVNSTGSIGVLSIVTPLTLDKATVYAGQTMRGTVTFMNTSSSAVTINEFVIAGRQPGAQNIGSPYDDFSPKPGGITIPAGGTYQLTATRTFTSSDLTGTWYSFATYADSTGV